MKKGTITNPLILADIKDNETELSIGISPANKTVILTMNDGGEYLYIVVKQDKFLKVVGILLKRISEVEKWSIA